ncbi:MAG: hypothetical protein WBB72_07635, partial [Methyloceanibacter sp.]
GQRFVSPDGDASLALYATAAEREPIAKHMNAVAFVDGEQITHLHGEENWIEVSGSKTDPFTGRPCSPAVVGPGMRLLSNIRRKPKAA